MSFCKKSNTLPIDVERHKSSRNAPRDNDCFENESKRVRKSIDDDGSGYF